MELNNKQNFFRTSIFNYFLVALLLSVFFIPTNLSAQDNSILPRISSATRGDNMGYVYRFHFNVAPDSFKVLQTAPNLVQIAIYKKDMLSSGIQLPTEKPDVRYVDITETWFGIGVDVALEDSSYFLANMYPDANEKHILLGLTQAGKKDVDLVTSGMTPIDWIPQPTFIAENHGDSTNFNNDAQNALSLEPDSTLDFPDSLDYQLPVISVYDDSYNSLKDKLKFDVIVIDPGHGGKDPGSSGRRVKEKDVTLQVALKLGAYIEEYMPDVKVVYTRNNDNFVELEERGHIANRAQGDLFVSIHADAVNNPRPNGSSFWFLGLHKSQEAYEVMKRENSVVRLENPNGATKSELDEEQLLVYELTNSGYMASSQFFAGVLDNQFKNRAQRRTRGVKQAGFIVLYYASMPAVLVELGFISNPSEERFMSSEYGQNILASAIFRSVRTYKEHFERSQHISTE